MNARIYARVSTEEQAASGFSLSAQQERLEAFCVSQGWRIAGRYIDEGVSAKDLNRPEFRRLMAEVEPGDVVLVYKLDRLTRSVRDLDDLLRSFERLGVMFRSATEQFDTTTATGRLFIRMVAEMAQWERETIAERTAFGKRKKAQEGEWPGGKVPLGYRTVPSERSRAGRTLLKVVPDPERWQLIPMIFDRYLSGHGVRSIAVWLNTELGARTLQGCKFHQLTVSRILTNPIYCGDLEYGRRGKGAKIRVRGCHEPLVSREVFDRVQSLMATHKSAAPRHATGSYPLAGIARCGVCGSRVDGHHRNDVKGEGGRVYRCHSYMTGAGCGGEGRRPLASVSARHAEESLVAEIERLHTAPASLGRLLDEFEAQAQRQMGMAQAERERLMQDLAEAEAALARWKRLFEKGHLEDDDFLAEVRPHLDRMQVLKQKLADCAEPPVSRPDSGEAESLALSFWESWSHLEARERKALLQRFVAAFQVEILIYPNRRVGIRPAH